MSHAKRRSLARRRSLFQYSERTVLNGNWAVRAESVAAARKRW
jgi:hypothetical protein